jgi:hypothetical protein
MKKIILSAAAAAAFALAGCGNAGVSDQTLTDAAGAIDRGALAEAVNQSIDRKAVEGLARGAVAGAVQEAIPAEIRAVGAVVDERALVRGVDQAVDGNALGAAVEGVIKGGGKPAGN